MPAKVATMPKVQIIRMAAARAPAVKMPAAPIIKYRTRVKEVVKRVGSKALTAAHSERHMLTALAAAGVLGLLHRFAPETIEKVSFGPIGPAALLGVGLYLIGRYTHNEYASKGATGLLSVAVYEAAAGGVAGQGQGVPERIGDVDTGEGEY